VSVDKAVAKKLNFEVIAKSAETRVIYAWASVSKDAAGAPVVDLDGDHIPISVLEKASHRFMKESRQSGDMHEGEPDGIVVASIVTTPELQKALGIQDGGLPQGWLIGVEVPAAVVEDVKKGDRLQMSIEGKARVREAA
jgi:hypothetical protein